MNLVANNELTKHFNESEVKQGRNRKSLSDVTNWQQRIVDIRLDVQRFIGFESLNLESPSNVPKCLRYAASMFSNICKELNQVTDKRHTSIVKHLDGMKVQKLILFKLETQNAEFDKL